ncbi:hypothetical protein KCP70_11130 [Salmonella enterica subsp. enterica]|nr:hypothetical protein KCP70_11130 [Salmonella enterica subsp. enterica]
MLLTRFIQAQRFQHDNGKFSSAQNASAITFFYEFTRFGVGVIAGRPPVIAGIDDHAFHNAGKQKPAEEVLTAYGGSREAHRVMSTAEVYAFRTRNFGANFDEFEYGSEAPPGL